MDDITTIQLPRKLAERLKEISSGRPYAEVVQELVQTTELPSMTKQISFKESTLALEVTREEHIIPFNGVITQVVISMAPGANYLVDARLVYIHSGKTEYVLPSVEGTFISLDNATQTYDILHPVEAGGTLRFEVYNYDAGNPHSVPAVAIIRSIGGIR